MEENEISNYKLKSKLIFKKFRVGKLILKTKLSTIHEGINELNGEHVAMKFEKTGEYYNFLESEAYYLILLKGKGIPKIFSYGKIIGFRVIVEELLGETLYFTWKNKTFDIKNKINDLCLIAIQCLDRLKYIHSKNTVHRDIKPYNFLFGKKDPNLIYLIDFGIAKKYRSSRTGKHIKFRSLKMASGSLRFMSINSNNCCEQSRKDDLESLGYMLVYLIKKTLPWLRIEKLNINRLEKFRKTRDIKLSTLPEELCSGLPKEFCDYIKYCRNLTFEQEPNYNYLMNLFLEIIKNNQKIRNLKYIGSLQFSWLKKNSGKIGTVDRFSNSLIKSQILGLRNYDLSKGKLNTHKRLYTQIKNSRENSKNKSNPKINKPKIFKLNLKNINLFVNNNISIDKSFKNNYTIENNYINTYKRNNNKKNNITINPESLKARTEQNIKRNKIRIIKNVKPLSGFKKINKVSKISENHNYSNHGKTFKFLRPITFKNYNYSSIISNCTLNLNKNCHYKTLKERESEEKKKIGSIRNISKKDSINSIEKFKYTSILISKKDNAFK